MWRINRLRVWTARSGVDIGVNVMLGKSGWLACVAGLVLSGPLSPTAAALPASTARAAAVEQAPGGSFVAIRTTTAFSSTIPAGGSVRFSPAGVPAGSVAWLTVTVAAPSVPAVITAFPGGTPATSMPVVTVTAGQAATNSAAIPTSAGGAVDMRNSATVAVKMRVDVSGYYTAGAPGSPGMFGSVSPVRVLAPTVIAPQATRTVTATGVAGVPTSAAIVLANLSVTAAAGDGVITAYPAGTAAPATHSLTFAAGWPQAALSAVRVSAAGQLTIVNNSSVPVTVAADIVGYFRTGFPTVAAAFTKAAPATLFTSTVAATSAVTRKVTGVAAIPATGVSAVAIQLTASGGTVAGNLTGYAAGARRPTTPQVPFVPGQRSTTLVIVPVSAAGSISVFNSALAAVTVRADVVGYYLGTSRLTWTAPQQINSQGPADFGSVSCTSPTFCMAGDNSGFFFRFDGSTWTRVGDDAFLTDDVYSLRARSMSCVSPTFCVAITEYSYDLGPQTRISTWNGTAWSAELTANSFEIRTASCTSPTFCIGTPPWSGTGWAKWNGSTWSLHSQASPGITDVYSTSCASTTFCLALLNGSAIRYNGTGWADAPGLTGADTLSCASATSCVATGMNTGGRPVSYKYNGSAWGSPVTAPAVAALSCRTSTFCVGVGVAGVSTFNGTSWSAPGSPIAMTGTSAVSCSSTTFCVVAAGNKVVTFNGTTFGAVVTVPDDPKPLNYVSCDSASFCMGADRVTAVTFAESGFVESTTIGRIGDPPLIVSGMSCAAATFCFANKDLGWSDEPGLARYDGAGWADVDAEVPPVRPWSVSCVSASFCAAISDVVYFFNGSTWTASTPQGYTRVSCGAANFCVATSAGTTGTGTSTTFNGTSWSAPKSISSTGNAEPIALSCQPAKVCVAADAGGRVSVFNGSDWSAPAAIAGAGPVVAVSCMTIATCFAVSSTGFAVQYSGSGWAVPVRIDSVGKPTAISCPSATFCAVVDDTGKAVFGRP